MLNPDYRDMLSALSAENVEFLLVGAFAMAAHGLVRATGDMDLWIRATPENAQRAWRALRAFGAPLFDISIVDLSTPDVVFQIGVAPTRIDILTSIDGIIFDEAWPHRLLLPVGDHTVPVISKADLVRNKRAAGRPKDLADVAWLEQSHTPNPD